MDEWQNLVQRIITRGVERGELRADIDTDEVATMLIATLEGAIMMSQLYGSSTHIRRAVAYLTSYINSSLRA
ncbi:MAG TPA: TetR/AcrR family transcriptional regulator C-terminal ligand-binding domain-containing protein, partial [Roseiflexaceae bacterium]|nr:TetR/AcrR family transcriptional regulator C-terminal ligand-binding domain-containing protein [Roseiflexaceae bacterium]